MGNPAPAPMITYGTLLTLLTLTLTLTQWTVCYGSEGQQTDTGLRQTDQDDLIFTGSHLLWATTRKTVVSCATACMSDQQCVSFTTTKTAAEKVECRGHSGHPTGGMGHQGSRLYLLQSRTQTSPTVPPSTSPPPPPTTTALVAITTANPPWLNDTCSDDSECEVKEANAECFLGHCLCTPGYFYSLSSATCLASCPPADLQDLFVPYVGYWLQGYKLPGYPVHASSWENCLEYCRQTSQCPVTKYRKSVSRCAAGHTSRFDASAEDWVSDSDFIYFQRTCR